MEDRADHIAIEPGRLRSRGRQLALACATVAIVLGSPSHAANECRIEYGYHTGSGFQRQDRATSMTLSVGQTRSINRSQLNYVKNRKNQKVQITVRGAMNNNFALDKDQVEPPIGFYLTPVTLATVKCLNQTSAAAFGSPEQLINAFRQAGKTTREIALGLQQTFHLSGQQVAALLKTGGFGILEVADALQSVFRSPGAHVANWLKAAGFSARDIATALKSRLHMTPTRAAEWLRGNFRASAQQLAQWLQAGGYSLVEAAEALAHMNFDPSQVFAALKLGFRASADQLVQAFKRSATFISNQNCGPAGCRRPAEWLKRAGYAAGDVLKALRTYYSLRIETAHDVAVNVFRLSGYALQQALAFAGYSAQEIAAVVRGAAAGTARAAGKAFSASAQATGTAAVRVARFSALAAYDAYFRIVAAGTAPRLLHSRYRNAFRDAGINANGVIVGYSGYLDHSDTAMTDCQRIYFPDRGIVQKLHAGQKIERSQLRWLLHELGHTEQCRRSSREAFANRWFGELPPSVVQSIERGRPDTEAIHDAMPLERSADAYAARNLRRVARSLGI